MGLQELMKHTPADDSLQAYWRLDDSLCVRALSIGKDPAHFPTLKAFFPFIREASLLRVPRDLDLLPSWLNLAFHAGFLYGSNLPSQAESLLDHHGVECSEALRRVRALRSLLEPNPATPGNLFRAFEHICKRQWRGVPEEQFLDVLVSATVKCFKVGLAGATVAKADPFLIEFVDAITPPIDAPRMPLSWRLMMWSPLFSHCRPLSQLVTHPLPRLAATHYPHAPKEREAVLPFFTQQLHAFGETTEDRCISAEDNILGWIGNALEYGRRIKINEPKRLREVFIEVGSTNLRSAKQSVRSLVGHAAGTDPGVIGDAILRWHKKAFEWSEPANHGRHLERVVHCSDFAIWISWLIRNHK
jgi:hypothetical protein